MCMINKSIQRRKKLFQPTGLFGSLLKIGRFYGVTSFDGNELNRRFVVVLSLGIVAQVMHFNGLYQIWPNIPYICNSLVVYTLILVIAVRFFNKFFRHDDEKIPALLHCKDSLRFILVMRTHHLPQLCKRVFKRRLKCFVLVLIILIKNYP
jgi:hypothetical protein